MKKNSIRKLAIKLALSQLLSHCPIAKAEKSPVFPATINRKTVQMITYNKAGTAVRYSNNICVKDHGTNQETGKILINIK